MWVHVIFIVLPMTFRNPISPTASIYFLKKEKFASFRSAQSYDRINFKSEAAEMFNFIVRRVLYVPSNVENCLSKSEEVSDKSVRANEAKGQKCTRKFTCWREE